MRILHTESSANWGGQEYRAQEQMKWLNARGHHCILAARPETEVTRRAEEGGLEVIPMPFRGHYSPRAILQARRAIRRHAIDVVDCHGSRDAATFAFARDLCPIVRTRHITQPLKYKLHRRLLWRYGCDHVIVGAHLVKDDLVASRLLPADRITVIGGWAQAAFFDTANREEHRASVRQEFAIPQGRPLITLVGMLRDDKGQDHFIRLVAEMRRRERPVSGLVVGSATQAGYERELRDLAQDRGVADDIVFAGYRDDIPRITQGSDVLAILSILEAQSRTAPQGFAGGTPVLAHRVGGVPELVRDGETGWLVGIGDIPGSADALCRILDEPAATQEITARARRFAEEHLRMDAKLAETLAVYEQVIRSRKPR
jgi:glycosyltransferase involved in cell wall biosynthesis